MEAYETARLEVAQFEEDVITASVTGCEEVTCFGSSLWIIYYSDGTSVRSSLLGYDYDEYPAELCG